MKNLELTATKTTLIYSTGLLGVVYALFNWNPVWAIAAICMHIVLFGCFSAVMHRYFAHRSYEANPILMWFLSTILVGYGYTTPMIYTFIHSAHHAYPDTAKDPNGFGWYGLLKGEAHNIPSRKFLLEAKWFYNKQHAWLNRNAFGIFFIIAAITLTFSLEAFVWLHLVPVFTLQFTNVMHKSFSHTLKRTGARNRWYLEYVIPAGGEWIHDEHHNLARKAKFKNRWYELDVGWIIVKLLAKPGTIHS